MCPKHPELGSGATQRRQIFLLLMTKERQPTSFSVPMPFGGFSETEAPSSPNPASGVGSASPACPHPKAKRTFCNPGNVLRFLCPNITWGCGAFETCGEQLRDQSLHFTLSHLNVNGRVGPTCVYHTKKQVCVVGWKADLLQARTARRHPN